MKSTRALDEEVSRDIDSAHRSASRIYQPVQRSYSLLGSEPTRQPIAELMPTYPQFEVHTASRL